MHSSYKHSLLHLFSPNRFGGIMVSVLASVDRGFDPRSGQTKDYKICICCFSAKHAALRRNNPNNVSEWSDMSIIPTDCCFSELALSGPDPGFVVRGGVSRRGVCGPLKVPSWSRVEPPWSSEDFRNYRHLFERQFWTNHTNFIRPKKTWFWVLILLTVYFCQIIRT
jgi:hypothetical protein